MFEQQLEQSNFEGIYLACFGVIILTVVAVGFVYFYIWMRNKVSPSIFDWIKKKFKP